eukprot:CAMPEP_0184856446 /NCGR_PEP_ID=MMETSP0580-20130426/1633_1 /TAXON_ID=1118495 /ORGANISM="Dactyliosolen fragilissimus" /LENGTH=1104 /DNA_ID=CAMNT_0027351495 /DNA_START=172 /DNA_END=3486 /DNA_ORIENTATION=+
MVEEKSKENGKIRRRRGRKGTKNDDMPSAKGKFQKSEKKNASESLHTTTVTKEITYKPHNSILIHFTDATPTWYECGRHTPGRDDTIASLLNAYNHGTLQKNDTPLNDNNSNNKNNINNRPQRKNGPGAVEKYRNLANNIYQREIELFRTHNRENNNLSKDEQWLESTMKKGTLKDRIAAMSVAAGTHPVHKLSALDMLLDLAGVPRSSIGEVGGPKNGYTGSSGQTNSRVIQMATEALADLFTHTFLPSHRKLSNMDSRPFFLYDPNSSDINNKNNNTQSTNKNNDHNNNNHKNNNNNNNKGKQMSTLSPRVLLLWRYEEMLKQRYSMFLYYCLGKTLSSASSSSSSSSTSGKSQSQSKGDTMDMYKSFALKIASGLLRDLPEGEQALLSMIVNKIGDPSRKIASAAAHQLRLLLETHPNMTLVIAREVQQLTHRPHLSPRALYNCIIFLNQLKLIRNDDMDQTEKNGNSKSNPHSALPASLINTYFQLFEVAIKKRGNKENLKNSKAKSNLTLLDHDKAMKSRLLGALLTGVNRAHPYLSSSDSKLMETHTDALYRISHLAPPTACTQALMLLFHLAVGSSRSDNNDIMKPNQATQSQTQQNNESDRFYRALYAKVGDQSMIRSTKSTTLFFNLVYKSMKYDTNMLRVTAFAKRLLHTTFHCSPASVTGALLLVSEVASCHPTIENTFKSRFVKQDIPKIMDEEGKGNDTILDVFDPTKRDPRAAFSRNSQIEIGSLDDDEGNEEEKGNDKPQIDQSNMIHPLWELSLTRNHYHPTVSRFTESMGNISYGGDPLRDFALSPFLDRFAFRNPKSLKNISKKLKRGESVGERRSGLDGGLNSLSALPVNDPEYWEKSKDQQQDDDFFRKFFAERNKRDEIKGIVRGTDNSVKNDEDIQNEVETDVGVNDKDVNLDWEDTDSEEERFVQDLAEKLMEDGAGTEKVNFDDEDPDMDDWSDAGSDAASSDGEGGNDMDFSEMDGIGHDNLEKLDESDSSSVDQDDVVNEDPFLEDEDDGIDDDDADNFDDYHLESQNIDVEDEPEKGKAVSNSFADASEYEEMIEKSWADRKRRKDSLGEDEDAPDKKKVASSSQKRKERKKKKGKK